MKVPPLNLTPDINRVGMSYPFSPEMLWRYPLSLPQSNASTAPSSPLLDVKNQMPTHLAPDPRMWSRDDVSSFLRWFEREFELPSIDLTKFCMNGKALCMLNKTDLGDRAPGAGDILHNTLQFLLRDAPQHLLPQSPLTPHHPLMSPTPLTPTSQPWSMVKPELHNLGHFLQQGGSVTLSPAPSEQSAGSPRHPDNTSTSSGPGFNPHSSSASTGSGQSDSEDSVREDSSSSPQRSPIPPNNLNPSFSVQALASLKQITDYQRATAAAAVAAAVHSYQDEVVQQSYQQAQTHPHLVTVSQAQSQSQSNSSHQQNASPPTLPAQSQGQSNNSSTSEPEPSIETGTNGRLLWDFLQQLLNDPQQRYSRYIAWKNRDTGVFKIVDPPGLAKLWGIQKNHLSMNYDKMSRALRYYYRVNILRKVQGERHCYQFLRNPTELKSIKNISMLRGAPLPSQNQRPKDEQPVVNQTPVAPMEEEGPTDLSMPSHHQRYAPVSQTSTNGHQSPVQYHHQSPPTIQTTNPPMDTEPQNLSIESRMVIKTEDFYE